MLIVAADALTRRGLELVVSEHDRVERVVGIAPADRPTAVGRALRPDAVVWDATEGDANAGWLDDLDAPVLALVPRAEAARGLLGRVRGLLERDVSEARLTAAVAAVACGLHVMDLAAADLLLPTPAQHVALDEPLTAREQQVLVLLADGLSNRSASAGWPTSRAATSRCVSKLSGGTAQ